MPILLLTGFDVWPPHTSNPSWEAVAAASPQVPPDWTVRKEKLPVSWRRGFDTLFNAWESDVGAVLAFGLADVENIRVERTARNNRTEGAKDVDDEPPESTVIAPSGPMEYGSGLPIDRIFNAFQEEGFPVEYSDSAGGFLCNYTFYSVMHKIAAENLQIPAEFIHVPHEDQERGVDIPLLARAVEIAAELTLAQKDSPTDAEGAI